MKKPMFIFVSVIFLAAFAYAGDKNFNPLDYKTSFHSLILSNAPAMKDNIKPLCFARLKNHIQHKDSFYSKVIETKYTVQVKDLVTLYGADTEAGGNTYEPKKGLFYHYTQSTQLMALAQEQKISNILAYLRRPKTTKIADMFWYIAGDPESSADYGPIQIRIHVSPEAKIFNPVSEDIQDREAFIRCHGGCSYEHYPELYNERKRTMQEIESELISKYHDLLVCKGLSIGEQHSLARRQNHFINMTVLEMLATEANQISLIGYYGAVNDLGWFQILGEWAVEKTEHGFTRTPEEFEHTFSSLRRH